MIWSIVAHYKTYVKISLIYCIVSGTQKYEKKETKNENELKMVCVDHASAYQ